MKDFETVCSTYQRGLLMDKMADYIYKFVTNKPRTASDIAKIANLFTYDRKPRYQLTSSYLRKLAELGLVKEEIVEIEREVPNPDAGRSYVAQVVVPDEWNNDVITKWHFDHRMIAEPKVFIVKSKVTYYSLVNE